MSETISVSGIVLSSMQMGENDRRVVLLTKELGKISAFVRGARRQGSTLQAASNPFVFGTFSLLVGRNSYNLIHADVIQYFVELAKEHPGVYYGFYFLEFAGYYGRENVEATDDLNLLFLSLKALLNSNIDNRLIRRVFELRLMTINGEYAPDERSMSPSLSYACRYIMTSPLKQLYTFALKEETLRELESLLDCHMKKVLDRHMKSLDILQLFI